MPRFIASDDGRKRFDACARHLVVTAQHAKIRSGARDFAGVLLSPATTLIAQFRRTPARRFVARSHAPHAAPAHDWLISPIFSRASPPWTRSTAADGESHRRNIFRRHMAGHARHLHAYLRLLSRYFISLRHAMPAQLPHGRIVLARILMDFRQSCKSRRDRA